MIVGIISPNFSWDFLATTPINFEVKNSRWAFPRQNSGNALNEYCTNCLWFWNHVIYFENYLSNNRYKQLISWLSWHIQRHTFRNNVHHRHTSKHLCQSDKHLSFSISWIFCGAQRWGAAEAGVGTTVILHLFFKNMQTSQQSRSAWHTVKLGERYLHWILSHVQCK